MVSKTEINVVNSNEFKSSKDSREKLMLKLSLKEQKMFKEFVKSIIDSGHHSVIEHLNYTVVVACDRGVSHEYVRHRLASYSQESTRYCNYTKGKFGSELTFVDLTAGIELCSKTRKLSDDIKGEILTVWWEAMSQDEANYNRMIELGASPQIARSVLPNSLKTEIVITMNLREWRHFFAVRLAKGAHPQMRELAALIYESLSSIIPVVFGEYRMNYTDIIMKLVAEQRSG